jgi:hypothetical protein
MMTLIKGRAKTLDISTTPFSGRATERMFVALREAAARGVDPYHRCSTRAKRTGAQTRVRKKNIDLAR